MKKLSTLALSLGLLTTVALANDAEKSDKTTVDTSKNIITGSHTVTKTTKKTMKHADGSSHDVKVTEKTKTKKNGEVETSLDVDAEAKSAKK